MSVTGVTQDPGCRRAAPRWPLWNSTPPLGALAPAAGAARKRARAIVLAWGMGGLADDAETVIGELVSNAVRASSVVDDATGERVPIYGDDGRILVIWVRLATDGTRLHAEVWDQAPGIPVSRRPGDDDEDGRGLAMVECLSSRCGWYPAPDGPGKCVWAELSGPG